MRRTPHPDHIGDVRAARPAVLRSRAIADLGSRWAWVSGIAALRDIQMRRKDGMGYRKN